jgi:hypothetical protein
LRPNSKSANEVWGAHKTWFLVRAPSRPASWQLAAIREWLSAYANNGEVAILGSTPEFQDLLAEFEHVVPFVIDRSSEFATHAKHQRRKRDRACNQSQFVHGDWTPMLRAHPARFSAILSDLTSGNIPYARRRAFYAAIRSALKPGGVLIDRVLTLERERESSAQIYADFEDRPLTVESVNELNCRLLFLSDLAPSSEERDIGVLMERAHREWTSPRGKAYLDALGLITPPAGRWWYGRPWKELEPLHAPGLKLLRTLDEPAGSAYHGSAKLYLKRKRSPKGRVATPSMNTRCQVAASRARLAAVLEETKALMDTLPLPDGTLGTAFAQRMVESAVALRDHCLNFKAERMQIETQHWRFMNPLFEQILDRPTTRERTYAFCWRFARSEVLFSPRYPEWKTLFAKAARYAAEQRIIVRALMVTDDRGAERLKQLEAFREAVGPMLQIAYIQHSDFESTKASDELERYLDFGVFGEASAFLTRRYEPTVIGEYTWAAERVIRLHEFFDRIWDQAEKARPCACANGTAFDDAFDTLVKFDEAHPVSCVASMISHGGAALELTGRDWSTAIENCATLQSEAERLLRDCIEGSLGKYSSDDEALRSLVEFAHRSGKARTQIVRHADGVPPSVRVQLNSMYFSDLAEYVRKNWKRFAPPGNPDEVFEWFSVVNRRPHAHAKEAIDLVDFALYRDRAKLFIRWLKTWNDQMLKGETTLAGVLPRKEEAH